MKIVVSNKCKPKPTGTIAAGIVPLPTDLASAAPQAMFCTIGPVEAARLLHVNTANRKASPGTIARYARDVAHGRFDLSNDAISVYRSGKLATGQHRCAAVMSAGKPILSLVLLGLPEAAAVKLDQPLMRKQYQNLHVLGELNGVQVSTTNGDIATARMLVGGPSVKLTMDELQTVLAKYDEALSFTVQHASREAASARAGIAAAYMAGVDPEVLQRFCEVLASGISEGLHESAAIRLREKLPTMRGSHINRINQRRMTMNAIKFFAKGHDTKKLPIPDRDLYPLGYINEELK